MQTVAIFTSIIVILITIISMIIKKRMQKKVASVNNVPVKVNTNPVAPRKSASKCQKQFAGDILCERPANMSFEDYRKHLVKQKEWIKNRKKGRLIYPGSGMPFVGDTSKLRFI